MRHIRSLVFVMICLLLALVGVLAGVGLLGVAHASTGTWTLTGSLNVPRLGPAATLLPNGKVLIAGGSNNGSPPYLTSAELYDSSTGTWTFTGSMNVARSFPVATLLANGKVLITGAASISELASAELYDPSSGTWSLTGSMNVARDSNTATLLPNGKVLVVGGTSDGIHGLTSAELYDPSSGTWSLTGSLNVARYNHTATLLPNSQVLVAGGYNNGDLTSAELYDPSSGIWSLTGALNLARELHTATLLPKGQVLAAGGVNFGHVDPAAAELYDPSSGTWTLTGSLNVTRYNHTATLLPNGQVLVAGNGASAELYDPSSGTWTLTGSMNVARTQHTATLLPNGNVLVAGGFNGSGPLVSAELFSLSSDTTPPVLQLPGTLTVDATSPQGAVITYAVSATDPDNPPSQLTISCLPATGSTFPIDTTTVLCSASDPAGNTATGSFQVVVKGAVGQIHDLISLVNSFHLPTGLQTSLDAKLQDASSALKTNDLTRACSDLTDFNSEVKAQSGKKLTVSQSKQLLAAATRIQAVLSC